MKKHGRWPGRQVAPTGCGGGATHIGQARWRRFARWISGRISGRPCPGKVGHAQIRPRRQRHGGCGMRGATALSGCAGPAATPHRAAADFGRMRRGRFPSRRGRSLPGSRPSARTCTTGQLRAIGLLVGLTAAVVHSGRPCLAIVHLAGAARSGLKHIVENQVKGQWPSAGKPLQDASPDATCGLLRACHRQISCARRLSVRFRQP